mgnify:CR=1 FL=1
MRIETQRIKGFSKDKQGLVGIGALIVFIAIVIISVVSAGALINATNAIEGQAYRTAERSTDTVATGINIKGVTGVGGADDTLKEVRVSVKKMPGSPGINLSKTVIAFRGDGKIVQLTWDDMHLFTIENNVDNIADNLDMENVSEDLRNEYDNAGFNLSDNEEYISISVEESGETWILNDENNDYEHLIRKEGEALEVYRTGIIVLGTIDTGSGPAQLGTERDMAEIVINMEYMEEEHGVEIGPNEKFEVSFIPEVGFKTYASVYAPLTIQEGRLYRIR